MSKQAEVQYGLDQEQRVSWIWQDLQADELRLQKSGEFDDFDYWVFHQNGFLRNYLEVKVRRKPLSTFGDAMFPLRKHVAAKDAWDTNKIPFLAVTEYACGAIVEVNLADEPSFQRNIARRDRPGMAPVPHVFYTKDKMRVLRASGA